MNKTVTRSAEVVDLAFAESEYMPDSTISPIDIAVAEERYVVPVAGRPLYERLLAGGYTELRNEYVAPVVAIFTRLGMQPMTDIRSGRFGTVAPRSEYYQPADRQQILDMRRSLREKGRMLQRRLSEYLELHAADFPEYVSEENIFNRCSTDGGIVQIL